MTKVRIPPPPNPAIAPAVTQHKYFVMHRRLQELTEDDQLNHALRKSACKRTYGEDDQTDDQHNFPAKNIG